MPMCEDLVCHAAELAYEFQVETLTTYTFEENERILSKHIMRLWSNFAKFSNPNGNLQVRSLQILVKYVASVLAKCGIFERGGFPIFAGIAPDFA